MNRKKKGNLKEGGAEKPAKGEQVKGYFRVLNWEKGSRRKEKIGS